MMDLVYPPHGPDIAVYVLYLCRRTDVDTRHKEFEYEILELR
jgi:hypothetical protein